MTARLPECPRCGYDLQGQIAAWHPAGDTQPDAACPTTGTCSECGLDFEWRFILVEGLASPRWFFETTRVHRLSRLIATSLRVLNPRRFWRAVLLEVSPRPRRLFIYAIFPLVALLLIHALVQVIGTTALYIKNPAWIPNANPQSSGSPWFEFAQGVGSYVETVLDVPRVARSKMWVQVALAMLIMPPLMLLCLPWTLARSKVRPAHILRACAYALTPLFLLIITSIIISTILAIENAVKVRGPWWSEAFYLRIDPLRETYYFQRTTFFSVHFWLLLWWLIYWRSVLKHGWRMSDYRSVFLALAIPSLLVFAILACFIPGAFTWAV